MAVVLQGVEQDALAVLGHDGLPEGRVDRVLDGLAEEIALLGDEPQMVVVARFPIDGAADLVQIELAAEDGVPPGDVILALEVPVEGLSRDAGVAADLGHGNLIERFVHRMKNFHLDAQIGGIEDVLAQGEVSDHRSAAFCSFRVCIRGLVMSSLNA